MDKNHSISAQAPRNPSPEDREAGDRLRNLRISRGLSQNELGRTIGRTGQNISKLERGRGRLSAPLLMRLAAALDVEPSELLAGPPIDITLGLDRQGMRALRLFKRLTPQQRGSLLQLMYALQPGEGEQ